MVPRIIFNTQRGQPCFSCLTYPFRIPEHSLWNESLLFRTVMMPGIRVGTAVMYVHTCRLSCKREQTDTHSLVLVSVCESQEKQAKDAVEARRATAAAAAAAVTSTTAGAAAATVAAASRRANNTPNINTNNARRTDPRAVATQGGSRGNYWAHQAPGARRDAARGGRGVAIGAAATVGLSSDPRGARGGCGGGSGGGVGRPLGWTKAFESRGSGFPVGSHPYGVRYVIDGGGGGGGGGGPEAAAAAEGVKEAGCPVGFGEVPTAGCPCCGAQEAPELALAVAGAGLRSRSQEAEAAAALVGGTHWRGGVQALEVGGWDAWSTAFVFSYDRKSLLRLLYVRVKRDPRQPSVAPFGRQPVALSRQVLL